MTKTRGKKENDKTSLLEPTATKTKLRQLRPLTDKLSRLKKASKKNPRQKAELASRLMPRHGALARVLLETFVFKNNKLYATDIENINCCKPGQFKSWRLEFIKLGFVDYRQDIRGKWKYHAGPELEEYVRKEKLYQNLVTQEQFDELEEEVQETKDDVKEIRDEIAELRLNQKFMLMLMKALFEALADIQINKPPITINKLLGHPNIQKLLHSEEVVDDASLKIVVTDLIKTEFSPFIESKSVVN